MNFTVGLTGGVGFLFALILGACPDRRVAAPPSSDTSFSQSIPTDVPYAGKNGYTLPKCLYCPDPQYSQEGLDAKIQGEVVLEAVIGTDGRVGTIAVKHSLGHGLDEEAIHSARDLWRFKPANGPDGKPAATRMLIDIDFHLY